MAQTTTLDAAKSRAQIALTASPIYNLRSLRIESDGEALFISGRVESFYHSQLAQEAVREVALGIRVFNAIDVDEQNITADNSVALEAVAH